MADDARQDDLIQQVVDIAQEEINGAAGGTAHVTRWYLVSEVEVIGAVSEADNGTRLHHSRSDNMTGWQALGFAGAMRVEAESAYGKE